MRRILPAVIIVCFLISMAALAAAGEDIAVALPTGVKAVWDIDQAQRESTATRERVCINGLWRWQPGQADAHEVPSKNWGYFKVPGCCPGITDYEQKDCQTLFAYPSWKKDSLNS